VAGELSTVAQELFAAFDATTSSRRKTCLATMRKQSMKSRGAGYEPEKRSVTISANFRRQYRTSTRVANHP
jgi:hypothetical protein